MDDLRRWSQNREESDRKAVTEMGTAGLLKSSLNAGSEFELSIATETSSRKRIQKMAVEKIKAAKEREFKKEKLPASDHTQVPVDKLPDPLEVLQVGTNLPVLIKGEVVLGDAPNLKGSVATLGVLAAKGNTGEALQAKAAHIAMLRQERDLAALKLHAAKMADNKLRSAFGLPLDDRVSEIDSGR